MLSFRSTTVVVLWGGVLSANAAGPARAQCPPTGAQCPLVRLLPCDLKPGDSLRGYAAEGNRIVAGAPGADDASPNNPDCNSGAVYVFRRDGTAWVQEARLTASQPACGKCLGRQMAISGDWMLVDSTCYDPNASYLFYLFARTAIGTWTQTQELAFPIIAGPFDGAVTIDGDFAAVGTPNDNNQFGTVFPYHRTDPNSTPGDPSDDEWVPEAPLASGDPGDNELFGFALSISGNWLAAADAWESDPSGGAVHMYERSNGAWVWRQRLTASDRLPGQYFFGNALALQGDRLVAGASDFGNCTNGCGAAYVFRLSGSTWVQEQRLVACDAAETDEFGGGIGVAIDGDRIVVGSHQDDDGAPDAGSAYVFEWNGSQWVDYTKLTQPDPPGIDDSFGTTVGITGSIIVVGTPQDDHCGSDSGSVYVFDVSGAPCINDTPLPCPDCNGNTLPDACDIDACTGDPACADCNDNGVPDECEADCNNNGCPDECDIAPGIAFSQAPSLSMGDDGVNWMRTLASTVAGPEVPIDLDNDTYTDLIVTSQSAQVLSVFLGHGDGTFEDRAVYPLSGNLPQNPAVGDCNNDGFMDVIVANRSDFASHFYLSLFVNDDNAGDGTLLLEQQISLGEGFTSQYVVTADFDRDGLLDLVSLPGYHPAPGFWFQALKNLGNCTFAAPVNCSIGTTQIGTLRAAVGDFNNDDWLDLAISKEPDEVVVLLNSAQGVFDCTMVGAPTVIRGGDFPVYPSAAHMDDDIHVDIVVSNLGQYGNMYGVTILWNNGGGAGFSAEFRPAAYPIPGPTSVADFDGDGDQDVMVGALGGPPFVLENLGARNFAAVSGCGAPPLGVAFANGDFNEDGREDLAGNPYPFNEVDIFVNDYGPISEDCNANGIPDECDIANCPPNDPSCQDCNSDGRPDECGVFVTCDAHEVQLLSASDAVTGDFFGTSVSISGDTMLVGAYEDDCPGGIDCGAVYVYNFNLGAPGQWIEQSKLTASNAASFDDFGNSVSLDGSTAIVGAPYADCPVGPDCGSAYIYRYDWNTWVEEQKFIASDAAEGDLFGFSISLDGTRVIVGAPDEDCPAGVNCGSAYVFRYDGTTWVEEQKLTTPDAAAGDWFGYSVSLDSTRAIVGARNDDCPVAGVDCGSAYIYHYDGTTWLPEQKLTASDAVAEDFFGARVSLDGTRAIVGAPYADCPVGLDCGSAYIYLYDGTTWVEEQKLTASDPAAGDYFGDLVSLHGTRAIVGAPYTDCPVGPDCGSAYVFRYDSGRPVGDRWVQEQKLTPSDAAAGDTFGNAVSLEGTRGIVGAPFVDCPTGVNCGLAYVFDLSGPDCNCNGVVDACDIADGTSLDCNANGIPDGCDIASGVSQDCNGDGVPNECDPQYCSVDAACEDGNACTIDRCEQDSCSCVQTVVTDCCPPEGPCVCSLDADCAASGRCCNAASHTCQPPPCLAAANRYLSLYPAVWWPGLFAPPTALRVTPLDFQNPVPPNLPQFPPPDFSAYESATCMAPGEANGCTRWVGKPGTFLESQDSPGLGSFRGARLQCTPYYRDWNLEGVIHVTGAEIVPSSIYHVESVSAACMGQEPTCTAVSAPAPITTTRSGDITERFNPPDPSTQPDALDVAQLVNKFKNVPGAPIKAIAQLQPNLPELNADINALDIVAVVDAVKQFAYAFSGPCPCPSMVPCGPAIGSVSCTTPTPCVTAFGAGALCVKTCTGGANDGDPCINDTHCPGVGATCGNGFCRDRCGRCTP